MFCACMDLNSQSIMPFDTNTAKKVPTGGTTLLIIDAQNDFHPGDENTLPVPNADEDAKRITKFITDSIDIPSGTSSIQRIVATLDTHHKLHIAHPTFWINDQNQHPDPFTFITSSDIEKGIWKPRSNLKLPFSNNKSSLLNLDILNKGKSNKKKIMNIMDPNDGSIDLSAYVLEYTKALEAQGKFKLQIWPEHCLIGSRGHNIVSNIHNALTTWSDVTGTSVEYVTKGQNLLTEMYSVLKAEVPISKETEFNQDLFQSLNASERIIVCGQAMSHCVNYSVRDLMENMSVKERKKVYLLKDCGSPVGLDVCIKDAEEFMKYVEEQGGVVCKAEDIS